jgi:hypothetical protein
MQMLMNAYPPALVALTPSAPTPMAPTHVPASLATHCWQATMPRLTVAQVSRLVIASLASPATCRGDANILPDELDTM